MVSAFLIACAMALTAPSIHRSDSTTTLGLAFNYFGVIQVDDSEKSLKGMIAEAEGLGGYFARKSQSHVELRIPTNKAQIFWQSLSKHGMVVDQNLSSENLATLLANLDARLNAKRKAMDAYLSLLQTAEDSSLSAIDVAINALQYEIDAATGEKNVAEDRLQYARLAVSFSFHDRTAPLPNGTTRFPWINDLSLQNLLLRFGHGK